LKVGVVITPVPEYPAEDPFHPSQKFPEYPFSEYISQKPNHVYEGIRQLFIELGMDKEHIGTPEWNPLGLIIKPGMTVVIKPNFLNDKHPDGKNIFSVITHPSLIRATIDYCWIALQGKGAIVIADTPQAGCDYKNLQNITKVSEITSFFSGFDGPSVQFFDLRDYYYQHRYHPNSRISLPGDPLGDIIINLKEKSEFYNHPHPEKFYGSEYNRQECILHHSGDNQEYQIAKSILNADVFISIPKMKVHKKVGVTLNIKGLVGICTNKNFLVHYCVGSPRDGGDQYPDTLYNPFESILVKIERQIYDKIFASRSYTSGIIFKLFYEPLVDFSVKMKTSFIKKKTCDTGNWYGNDSAWRMAVDLLKIINFSDKIGIMHEIPQRKFFSIVDGVIGGENNGPISPDPKPVGIIIGGDNLVAVDLVATTLMGFDYKKIKLFSIIKDPRYDFKEDPFESIETYSNRHGGILLSKELQGYIPKFVPHPGWRDHIEIL
jgi:uncharacterized protein (DUF362 family)